MFALIIVLFIIAIPSIIYSAKYLNLGGEWIFFILVLIGAVIYFGGGFLKPFHQESTDPKTYAPAGESFYAIQFRYPNKVEFISTGQKIAGTEFTQVSMYVHYRESESCAVANENGNVTILIQPAIGESKVYTLPPDLLTSKFTYTFVLGNTPVQCVSP